ncbi:hypothetical protein ACLQ24_27780, partial [Micromonospora sp. DT4]
MTLASAAVGGWEALRWVGDVGLPVWRRAGVVPGLASADQVVFPGGGVEVVAGVMGLSSAVLRWRLDAAVGALAGWGGAPDCVPRVGEVLTGVGVPGVIRDDGDEMGWLGRRLGGVFVGADLGGLRQLA